MFFFQSVKVVCVRWWWGWWGWCGAVVVCGLRVYKTNGCMRYTLLPPPIPPSSPTSKALATSRSVNSFSKFSVPTSSSSCPLPPWCFAQWWPLEGEPAPEGAEPREVREAPVMVWCECGGGVVNEQSSNGLIGAGTSHAAPQEEEQSGVLSTV